MSPNPIKEIQQTKDELAREAEYDVHRFFKNLRDWSSKNRFIRKSATGDHDIHSGAQITKPE